MRWDIFKGFFVVFKYIITICRHSFKKRIKILLPQTISTVWKLFFFFLNHKSKFTT